MQPLSTSATSPAAVHFSPHQSHPSRSMAASMGDSATSDSSSAFTSRSNLIVNYIPLEVTEQELHDIFAQFGAVESARLIRDKASNMPKGYGFVKFRDVAEAENAKLQLDGFRMYGKQLKVGFASEQPGRAAKPARVSPGANNNLRGANITLHSPQASHLSPSTSVHAHQIDHSMSLSQTGFHTAAYANPTFVTAAPYYAPPTAQAAVPMPWGGGAALPVFEPAPGS